MNTFDLKNFIPEIQVTAEQCKCSFEQAVDKFIVNLTTMKEHYPSAKNLNFHELGQHWNKLPYKVKNTQKSEVLQRAPKAARVARRVEE